MKLGCKKDKNIVFGLKGSGRVRSFIKPIISDDNKQRIRKTRKYYVNELILESSWTVKVIGLFTECECGGTADCQAEYYRNTKLLAKYEIHGESHGVYNPARPYINYTECELKLKKVAIGSGYWTKLIEAESDEEARELFQKQQWVDCITPHTF